MSVSLRADFTLIDGRLEPNQVVHVGRDGLIEEIESRGRGQHAATPTMTVSGDVGSTPGDFSTASKSFMKAGQLYGDMGDPAQKRVCLEYARENLEKLRAGCSETFKF